jgi:putative NADH-flavin reductase
VTGDGRDRDAVRRAISGADAVIAIVAAATRKGPHHTAAVVQVITEAMTDLGTRRFAITNPYPIVADRPRLPIALLRFALADAYADAARMEEIVTASNLDWTILRLNRLTNKPATGDVRISRDLLDRPTSLTRADAAATLLDAVEDASLARSAVNVAGRGR